MAPCSSPGPLGRSGSLAALAPASLRLLALKPAEDGTGDLVLRVQETAGRTARASFLPRDSVPIPLGIVPPHGIASWRLSGGSATPVDASER
jgi:hypothetical protein